MKRQALFSARAEWVPLAKTMRSLRFRDWGGGVPRRVAGTSPAMTKKSRYGSLSTRPGIMQRSNARTRQTVGLLVGGSE